MLIRLISDLLVSGRKGPTLNLVVGLSPYSWVGADYGARTALDESPTINIEQQQINK